MEEKRKIARFNISKRERDEKWQLKRVGSEKALKLFDTQKEAIAYGRIIATNQNATVVLYKTNGSQITLRKLKRDKQ